MSGLCGGPEKPMADPALSYRPHTCLLVSGASLCALELFNHFQSTTCDHHLSPPVPLKFVVTGPGLPYGPHLMIQWVERSACTALKVTANTVVLA